MFGKNRNKKVGLCVMVVAASLVLATVWAVLVTPETALAAKPDKQPGGGKADEKVSVHYWWSFDDVLGVFDASDCPLIGKMSHSDTQTITLNHIQGCGVGGSPVSTVGALPGISEDPDLTTCFPDFPNDEDKGTALIWRDETTEWPWVQVNVSSRSRKGGPQGYKLIIDVVVVDPPSGTWKPFALLPGESATLLCGEWTLRASSGPASKGCEESGDFLVRDDSGKVVGTNLAITVTRFTENEEIVCKDDNPDTNLEPPYQCP